MKRQEALRRLRLVTFGVDSATIVARARGLFAAEGLDLEVTVTPSSTQQMRGLGQGTYDIASTAFDNVLAWSGREGAEIVAVAQSADRTLLPVFVRPEIKGWDDLRGKTLAADAVDTAYALVLRRILLAHGLDLRRGDYELRAVGATGQRLESMKRGETFAAVLNPPFDAQGSAAGMVRFGDQRELLPHYPGGVWAVNQAWAGAHREAIAGFLRAWLAGARWARDPANHEEALALVAVPQGLSREAAAASLERVADGALNLAGLQSVVDLRVELGFTLPKGTSLAPYYDLTYYREALKR
jgi:ABC-type nitrate/sulfonate/bicarbonate transport system substrate-binding protein